MSKEMREQINKVKNFGQFLNENKSYISNGLLNYVIDEDYFKSNGYRYQELFASDVPYYHKVVGERTIWCRVEDKMVFIEDWYDFLTPTILNYFVKYRNSEDVKYSKTFDYHFLSLRLNRETGEIVNKTYDMVMNDDSIYNNRPWTELVLPIEETNKILDEINRITNNKFK